MDKRLEQTLHKENNQIKQQQKNQEYQTNSMKRYWTSLIIQETPVKATVYGLTPTIMAKKKKMGYSQLKLVRM